MSNSEKLERYDRQLRLWGDHGQARLEKSSICCIGASTLATEILKNIVLPGIKSFSIIDHEMVTEADKGTNFFLLDNKRTNNTATPQYRCELATKTLCELNKNVQGHFLCQQIEEIIQDVTNFAEFSIIIAAIPLTDQMISRINEIAARLDIPFLYCVSMGCVGVYAPYFREHAVTEPHSTLPHLHLRLDRPFPALLEFLAQQNHFENCDRETLLHTPWPIIYYEAVGQLRATGSPTNESRECVEQLESIIKKIYTSSVTWSEDYSASTSTSSMLNDLPANFKEAIKNLKLALKSRTQFDLDNLEQTKSAKKPKSQQDKMESSNEDGLSPSCEADNKVCEILETDDEPEEDDEATKTTPKNLRQILKHPRLQTLHLRKQTVQEKDDATGDGGIGRGIPGGATRRLRFWAKIAALRRFVLQEKSLPLNGSIPDMTSDSKRYIHLFNIYKEEAEQQQGAFTDFLRDSCEFFQINFADAEYDEFSASNLRVFLKHCHELELFSTRRCILKALEEFQREERSKNDTDWCLAVRSSIWFRTSFGRFPESKSNSETDSEQHDLPALHRIIAQQQQQSDSITSNPASVDKFLREAMRWSGAEMHSTCAFMGGVVAHEIIKLLTGQYKPLNTPMLYNAIDHSIVNF